MTVDVRFNLSHWCIKKGALKEDVYVAYIDNMSILPGPTMVLSSPAKKRRIDQPDPLAPSKRQALHEFNYR